MKEYRIRINSGRILGPILEEDLVKTLVREACDGSEEIQLFPTGDWKSLKEFPEFSEALKKSNEINEEKTFVLDKKSLDGILDGDISKEVEEKREFNEFKFTHEDPFEDEEIANEVEVSESASKEKKEEELLEKTQLIQRPKELDPSDEDKTQINKATQDYLKQIREEAQAKEKVEEENKLVELEDEEPDYNNDKTEVITLDILKEEIKDSKKNEKELNAQEKEEVVRRRKEMLASIELEEIEENSVKEIAEADSAKQEDPKKKKKIIYIIVALVLLYLLLGDDGSKTSKKKAVKTVSPKINFPIQFDIIDKKKARNLYRDGLLLYKKESYISLIKAAKKFKESAENQFKDNNAVARLIFVYSHLLEDVDSFGPSANTVFKLVQIFKSKELADPYFASAISYFYLKVKKVDASVKIVEKYLALANNKPTAELFTVYLFGLLEQGNLIKAKKVADRLLREKKRSFLNYRALLKYFNIQQENENYIKTLEEASKKYPNSVYFLILKGELFLENNEFDQLAQILKKIKAHSSGHSKVYYAQYLKLKGMYLVSKNKVASAVKHFKKSLKLYESNDLIAALAELKDINGKSDGLITESKARKKILESKKAYLDGNSKIALNYALEATNIAPNFLPARIYMAKLQIERGYLEDAMLQLSSLYKQYRSSTDVLYALIDVYTRAYKFNDTKKLLNAASGLSSRNDDRHASATAKYFLYKGNLNRASGWLQRSINSNPLNDKNVYELAKLYIKYYKFKKAKFYLKKAMDLDPANLEYRISFAEILYEVESSKAAITYLSNILEDFPDNPELLSAIGIYYYRSGQIKQYETIKSKLLAVSTKGASLYRFLMESGKLEENYDLIVKSGLRLLEIKPGDSETRLYLAQVFIEQEKYKDAFKQLREIKSRLSTYPRLQYFFAKLYLLNGDAKRSKELAMKEIKENPEVVDGYLLLGDIYKEEKDMAQAQKQYFKANQKDPKNIDAIVGLAFVAFSYDQYDMALDQYQKAIEIDPTRPDLYRMLGNAYRKLGQGQLAIKNYKHFLELSPNSSYKSTIQTYINTMQ